MERVLVTGCGGFVGRYLVEALAQSNYDVYGVDRKDHVEWIKDKKYHACDLTDQSTVVDLLNKVQPRHIVHLAAQSSAGRSFAEPHLTLHTNVTPILHLLEYLRTSESSLRLLSVGSADVYGVVDESAMPLQESLPPQPTNPYSLSKTIQEMCCARYAELYDVDVVSTRSFNHTGAGQRTTFVLPSFAEQILEIRNGERDAVVKVGNVEPKRDFSDVRDVCRAYVLLLEKGKRGEIYNVCSNVSYSIRSLLEKLASLAGVSIELQVDPERLRKVEMMELRGDYGKLAMDTGWAPEISIDDTLRSLLGIGSSS